jgi:RimJ/RimL family protein N-acetyltransferase
MEFDRQPTLRGILVELRPLLASDFEALFAAASDPLLWEQHPEPDRYKRAVFEKFFEKAMESQGALAIVDLKTEKIIGTSRYYLYDPGRREVAIGYTFVERAFWGAGYNPEAKKLMLDHAFKFVDRVIFEVGEGNLRSRKAMENIGAKLVGHTELPLWDGTMHPFVVYAITQVSFPLNPRKPETGI